MDVGKQFSVEASGMRKANSAEKAVPEFLLVEGRSPIRLDIIAALRKRFPDAVIKRVYPNSSQELQEISWKQYDLVLISCPSCIDQRLSWLSTIKRRRSSSHEPLVVVMTENRQIGREAVWEGADLYLQYDVSVTEFSVQLDTALEVDRLYRKYPLALPEWHLLEVLHDSENAVIFLVENQQGERAVIKRFKFDVFGMPPEILDHFMADAMTLMEQNDPGLVKLLDAGVTDSALYLVMEYVGGVTLSYMLDEQEEIDATQSLDWFVRIARSLATIHSFGLLHRDLKSSNIMMREDGSLVLLDFGIENQFLLDCGFLQDNEIYCTPFYVSPERIVGEPATVQSDLYALGVLFYELLAGDKPFLGSNLSEVLQKHVFSPAPELPQLFRIYQPLLSALLAKSPEGRIKTAGEVLDWLDTLANQQAGACAA